MGHVTVLEKDADSAEKF
ncbi:hypothetical protein ACVRW7_08085 [Streptococcus ratti]